MRRVLAKCWGPESSVYAGRRLTLYGDPEVKFGGQKVGGIRIAALSHLEEPVEINLTVTRGKRVPFIVRPLETEPVRDESGRDWLKELSLAGDDLDALTALGEAATKAHAGNTVLGMIRTEYKRVKNMGADK